MNDDRLVPIDAPDYQQPPCHVLVAVTRSGLPFPLPLMPPDIRLRPLAG